MNAQLVKGWLRWESMLALVLVIEFACFASLSPYFLNVWTLSDATFNFTERAVIALPLALLSSPARSISPSPPSLRWRRWPWDWRPLRGSIRLRWLPSDWVRGSLRA
jgi:hypothetical protein